MSDQASARICGTEEVVSKKKKKGSKRVMSFAYVTRLFSLVRCREFRYTQDARIGAIVSNF